MLKWIRRTAALMALLLAVTSVAYAIFILIGRPIPNLDFPRIPGGTPGAIFPIISSILIIVGVGTNRLAFAWIGDLILFVFGLIFVFGIGGGYLFVAIIQAVLLSVLQATAGPVKG